MQMYEDSWSEDTVYPAASSLASPNCFIDDFADSYHPSFPLSSFEVLIRINSQTFMPEYRGLTLSRERGNGSQSSGQPVTVLGTSSPISLLGTREVQGPEVAR